jgi:methylated-DNA-protein-cysteine methyltransferase related protein
MAAGFDWIPVVDSNRMDRALNRKKYSTSVRPSARIARKRNVSASTHSSAQKAGQRLLRIEASIRRIPKGKVSTYGAVARAAGFSGGARLVARVLHRSFGLPWQRVLGAGGEIKLRGDSAIEQRLRLEAEGVRFRGRKVDMKAHEWKTRAARYRD